MRDEVIEYFKLPVVLGKEREILLKAAGLHQTYRTQNISPTVDMT